MLSPVWALSERLKPIVPSELLRSSRADMVRSDAIWHGVGCIAHGGTGSQACGASQVVSVCTLSERILTICPGKIGTSPNTKPFTRLE
jgi:hypothetical protein